jgi:hypothetical protein
MLQRGMGEQYVRFADALRLITYCYKDLAQTPRAILNTHHTTDTILGITPVGLCSV